MIDNTTDPVNPFIEQQKSSVAPEVATLDAFLGRTQIKPKKKTKAASKPPVAPVDIEYKDPFASDTTDVFKTSEEDRLKQYEKMMEEQSAFRMFNSFDAEENKWSPSGDIKASISNYMPKALDEYSDVKKLESVASNAVFNAVTENKNVVAVIDNIKNQKSDLINKKGEEIRSKYDLTTPDGLNKATKELNFFYMENVVVPALETEIGKAALKTADAHVSELVNGNSKVYKRTNSDFFKLIDSTKASSNPIAKIAATLTESVVGGAVSLGGSFVNILANAEANTVSGITEELEQLKKNKMEGVKTVDEYVDVNNDLSYIKQIPIDQKIADTEKAIERLREDLSKTVSTIEGIADFKTAFNQSNIEDGISVEDIVMLVGESLPSMAVSAAPYFGLPLMAMSEYGSGYIDVIKSGLQNDGKEVNEESIAEAMISGEYDDFVTNATFAVGKAALEKLGAEKLVGKFAGKIGFGSTDMMYKSLLKGEAKQFLKKGTYNLATSGATEFATEGTQELLGQVSKGIQLGDWSKFVDFEAAKQAGQAGGIVGLALPSAGMSIKQAKVEIRTAARNIAMMTDKNGSGNLSFVGNYFKAAKADLNGRFEKGELSKADLNEELEFLSEAESTGYSIPKKFDKESKTEVFDLIMQKKKKQKALQGVDDVVSSPIKEEIKAIDTKIKEASAKGFILAGIKEDIAKGDKFNEKYLGGNLNIVSFGNKAERTSAEDTYAKALTTDKGFIDKVKNERKSKGLDDVSGDKLTDIVLAEAKSQAKADFSDAKSNYGMIQSDVGDSQYIFINTAEASADGIQTTALHEVLHAALNNASLDVKTLGKSLISYLGIKVDNDGNFTSDVDGVNESRHIRRLKDYYTKEKINNGQFYEEALTLLSEAIKAGEITKKSTLLARLLDFFNNALDTIGLRSKKYKFETGEDVYNFINDYTKAFDSKRKNKGLANILSGKTLAKGEIAGKDNRGAFKSQKISDSDKKDIFSKSDRVYEQYSNDPMYKDNLDVIGVMVGMEWEPMVRKMLKKYRDVFGLGNELEDIVSDVTTNTAKGYGGIPALVKTYDPSKGASLSTHIFGSLDKRILGIIQNKYKNVGATVGLDTKSYDKEFNTESDTGYFDGGFADSSSPDIALRVSRKKASDMLKLPAEITTKIEGTAKRTLMGRIPDMSAKSVGSVSLEDGTTADVNMYEGNTAKITINGTSTTIKARTPKDVIDYLNKNVANTTSKYEKARNFREIQVDSYKADFFTELMQFSGQIFKAGTEASPEYISFVENAFPLYKNYISQSSVSRRFAEFAEPVMDPATGKQEREKTPQGNPVFKKKDITMKEWKDFFVDGGGRLDGKKRSLIDALAQELGFDAAMENLMNEEFRSAFEQRRTDLSEDLADNYLSLISKSLDREIPSELASEVLGIISNSPKFSSKTSERQNPEARAKSTFIKAINFMQTYPTTNDIFKVLGQDTADKVMVALQKFYDEVLTKFNSISNTDLNYAIQEVEGGELTEAEKAQPIGNKLDLLFGKKSPVKLYKFINRSFPSEDVQVDGSKAQLAFKAIVEKNNLIESGIPTLLSFIPKGANDVLESTTSQTKNVFSSALGFTSRGAVVLYKKEFGKPSIKNRDAGGAERVGGFGTEQFGAIIDKTSTKFLENMDTSKLDNIDLAKKKELDKIWNEVIASSKNTFLNNDTKKVIGIAEKIDRDYNLTPVEKSKTFIKNLSSDKSLLASVKKEQKLKKDFLFALLSSMDFAVHSNNKKWGDQNGLEAAITNALINNDNAGIRRFSETTYYSFSEAGLKTKERDGLEKDEKAKNEHLEARAQFAAELLHLISNNSFSKPAFEKAYSNYQSLYGQKDLQKDLDEAIGKATGNTSQIKKFVISLNSSEGGSNPDIMKMLSSTVNINTGNTLLQETMIKSSDNTDMESVAARVQAYVFDGDTQPGSIVAVDGPKASAKISDAINNMIERKKGIPAKEEISAARAMQLGKGKGRFDFFISPAAEDFAGMMYKFLGKGKEGDEDMKIIEETLLRPYDRAENAISTYKQKMAEKFAELNKELKVIDDLADKTAIKEIEKTGFTPDQATRVFIWNKLGYEIPDITLKEKANILRIFKSSPKMEAFAEGIILMTNAAGKYPEPGKAWYAGSVKKDLYDFTNNEMRAKFLEPWTENVDAAFSKENMNKIEAAYGKNFRDNLSKMIRSMKTGMSERSAKDKDVHAILDWINGSVGVTMFLNVRSAALQTISAVNFLNWSDNNPLAAGKAIANVPEFVKTFKATMNSDFLKQRRGGLEMSVEDADLARALEMSNNKVAALYHQLIKIGYKPTQIMDSFAIAAGGTPFLINRTKTYKAEMVTNIVNGKEVKERLYTDKEAESKAFDDFRALAEEHQQSSRQDRLSNIQTGPLGRVLFAFGNTSFQMTRLQKKAFLDLKNNRGDFKTNMSKFLYYGFVQNAIFFTLQQGLGFSLFDDDEEKATKAQLGLANSMLDSSLNSLGLQGKAISLAKNVYLSYEKESEKPRPDYSNVLQTMAQVSPPIGTKVAQVNKYLKAKKYGKPGEDKVLGIENFDATLNLASAITNVPFNRLNNKFNNLKTAYEDESISDLQRLGLVSGWSKYSLGIEPDYVKAKQAKADAQEKDKADKKEKALRAKRNKYTRKDGTLMSIAQMDSTDRADRSRNYYRKKAEKEYIKENGTPAEKAIIAMEERIAKAKRKKKKKK